MVMLLKLSKMPVACHAPPLSDELLEKYRATIEAQPAGPVRDALAYCLACVEAWWELPESTCPCEATYRTGSGKKFEIVPLEPEHIQMLDPVTPWRYECEAMQALFNANLSSGLGPEIPATAERPAYAEVVDQAAFDLRRMASHLLWYAMEITRDREPLSADKLVPAS